MGLHGFDVPIEGERHLVSKQRITKYVIRLNGQLCTWNWEGGSSKCKLSRFLIEMISRGHIHLIKSVIKNTKMDAMVLLQTICFKHKDHLFYTNSLKRFNFSKIVKRPFI